MYYATTRNMIDAVIEAVNGGQTQGNLGGITPGQVHFALNQARCAAVFRRHFQDRANGDITIDDAFVHRFEEGLEVLIDQNRKAYYIELPFPFLDLPRLMGIVHVGPMEDPWTQYVVRHSGHLAVSIGSAAQDMGGIPYCFPEGQRIYLMNVNTGEFLVKRVFVKVVPGMAWDDLDAPTAIPSSMQQDVVAQLIQKFSGVRQVPADQSNDGNKNTL